MKHYICKAFSLTLIQMRYVLAQGHAGSKLCSNKLLGVPANSLTCIMAIVQLSLSNHTTSVLQPFSGTTWVSRCQKRTSALYGARED